MFKTASMGVSVREVVGEARDGTADALGARLDSDIMTVDSTMNDGIRVRI